MEFSIQNFDINTFESTWEELSELQKAELVDLSARLDPSIAIIPTLKGLASYHFTIRNNARKTLETLQTKIALTLEDPSDKAKWEEGLNESDKVCYRIYCHIESSLPINEQTFFLKTLLNIKGKGAYYAFKAVYLQRITLLSAKKILITLPEIQRINFIDKILQSSASIRLKFGGVVKQLLNSIQDRSTIVKYFAHLFDRNRAADPILFNLAPYLIDPDQLELREMRSPSPELRIMGLKAYAMMAQPVSSDILLDILATESDQSVRLIVFEIIEKSSFGAYPEFFYPLLEMMQKLDENEQYQAFKAMLVSGKLPVYSVMDIIRDNFPKLMAKIKIELSDLSRLSFMVLQDIALNKAYYELHHRDLNIACIFGLIKKRPERVVRLLKKFDNITNDKIRISLTGFIERTKALLSQEKKDISTQFDALIEKAESEKRKTTGLIKKILPSEGQKKVKILLENKDSAAINFRGESICDADLGGVSYLAASLFFSNSLIINCDFSGASFFNTFWKGCLFYNIDMRETRFDWGNFDRAVFINVNAAGAQFKNCSFEATRFFNCNFNHAQLAQASLIGSTISKTSFNGTDLTGAALSFSKLSAVSFIPANIEQADFSKVKARFCRFPYSFQVNNAHIDIDFNRRKFQVKSSELPIFTSQMLETVNQHLFCEFIHYGERKFSKQNQMSLLTAFDIFRPKQAHLFRLIPYLLHDNVPFPGLEETNIHQSTPCGIFDYIPDQETIQVYYEYTRHRPKEIKRDANPSIEGLFTIGSVGSLAQTADSDIDYWVCIHEDAFTDIEIKLLRQKLEQLERFALKNFGIQITFFLVDIFKAKNNDFGDSTIESSGSAQARLLKEEFYRSMIHVAGKLPLWTVLPTSLSLHHYNTINQQVNRISEVSRYIDLGDIHAISTSEYFGASIWQMFKWLKSPFKSVIKMALLEKFIFEYGKKPLLCNIYKDAWMNSGLYFNLSQNDSYYILLDSLIHHYTERNSSSSVSILLTCFFLKLGISNDSQIENTIFGLRKILLEKCLTEWGWQKEVVFEIGNFKSWPYSEISRLSTTIENYMVKKYKVVNQAFEKILHKDSQISPEDRTVLGRKVLIEFIKQPGKVGKVLLVSRSNRHFSGLHLKYLQKIPGPGTWELVNKNTKAYHNHEESLIRAKTVEEIAAWLINNGLYNESSVINLVPNPTYVTYDEIRKLFTALNDFLKPVLKDDVGFEQLLQKNRIEHVFVSINFYAPKQQHQVTEYTAVYLNSWGEMFCKSVYLKQGFASMEQVKNDLLARMKIDRLPANTAFYFSKGVAR